MISTVEKVLFLKSVDLFSAIPGEDLAQLAEIAQEIIFEANKNILAEGEMGDSMFLIVEGKVSVHSSNQIISTLQERETFGEMAILDNEPRSASVTAIDDVTCLKIEREDFYELMSEKTEIAHGIIRVLTQRLRQANQKLSPPAKESPATQR